MVRDSYQMAVGLWGIQPGHFWDMSPEEWWWLYEARRPRDREADYAGKLTEQDCEELYEMIH